MSWQIHKDTQHRSLSSLSMPKENSFSMSEISKFHSYTERFCALKSSSMWMNKGISNFYVININNILEVTSNSIGLFSNEEKLSWSRSHSKTVVQTRSLDFHPIVQWSFCQIMPPLRFPKFICDVFRKVLFLKISEISEK